MFAPHRPVRSRSDPGNAVRVNALPILCLALCDKIWTVFPHSKVAARAHPAYGLAVSGPSGRAI